MARKDWYERSPRQETEETNSKGKKIKAIKINPIKFNKGEVKNESRKPGIK
ncbi:hypothetical protein [Terrihalobacillus insolitus]|uniref:hypothetical protein n=1 Tax=Terrihalobacillus insolitus TaxID=2950438 RepID=UPI0023400BD6|nr:hypothetical protein [Terrihalobacillus insolitus]MDC3414261.1 hypothetical protein [Terrihalobacillus insolitus]